MGPEKKETKKQTQQSSCSSHLNKWTEDVKEQNTKPQELVDLVWALRSAFPASCKTAATFIDSIHQNNQPGKSKESRNEIRLPTNCVALPWSIYAKPKARRGRLGTLL